MEETPMFEKIKELLVNDLQINPDDIKPEAELVNDLGINSLELADLILLCLGCGGCRIKLRIGGRLLHRCLPGGVVVGRGCLLSGCLMHRRLPGRGLVIANHRAAIRAHDRRIQERRSAMLTVFHNQNLLFLMLRFYSITSARRCQEHCKNSPLGVLCL